MARSRSSKRWLAEYFDDPYVKRAQKMGLRSRSAFKFLELHEKHRLVEPGMTVVDLGCAPGGWTQVAQSLVGDSGRVIGLDILPMDPLQGVQFIRGDFTETTSLEALESALAGGRADLVLSDMAPNMSGMAAIDQARAFHLAELALEFAGSHLKTGGNFLVKLFQGEGFDAYVREVRSRFDKASVRKPDASRARSREVYLLALGHQVK
jgi:23S rRNA (uridine2552-2'-O)-methyltransferase